MKRTVIEKELLDFCAANGIYPVASSKGKIYFKCSRKGVLTAEKAQEIIWKLSIKTKRDCKRIRNVLKKRAAALRQTRPIKKWIKSERPREMLLKDGPAALSLSKLMAIILRTGKEGTSAEELSRRLLNKFGALRRLDSAEISEICEIEGIGPAKAAQVKAALELGKRLYRETAQKKKKKIKRAEEAVDYVAEYYGPYVRDACKEFFYVILLDTKNRPVHHIEISKGTISASIVDQKEIIKEATLRSASSIILVHNHPSGDAEPSAEDTTVTDRIVKACDLVGINVLDHIIIGKNKEDYYSFSKHGLLR